MVFGGGSDDIEITVTLKGDEAQAAADRLTGQLSQTGQEAEKAARQGFDKLQASIITINQAFDLAGRVISGFTSTVGGLIGGVIDLADAGEKLGSLQQFFDDLGGDTQIIDQARDRVLGLVSATDLYAIANKALVQGLPDVNENFADIVEAGGRLANTLGRDVTTTVEQLTEAIAKGRPAQLQQLGLIVDADAAYADYAKQLGVTVESLDRLQKQEAIQRASLAEVQRFLGETSELTDSVSNANASLGKTLEDLTGEIGKVVNENDQLAQAFRDLENFIIENKDAIIDLAVVMTELLAKAITFLSKTALPGLFVGLSTLREAIQGNSLAWIVYAEVLSELAGKVPGVGLGFKALASQLGVLRQRILQTAEGQAQAARIMDQNRQATNEFSVSTDALTARTRELGNAINSTSEKNEGLLRSNKNVAVGAKELEEELKKLEDRNKSISKAIEDVIGVGARAGGLREFERRVRDMVQANREAGGSLEDLADDLKELGRQAEFAALEIGDMTRIIQEEVERKSPGIFDTILKELTGLEVDTKRSAEDIADAFNATLASQLGAGLQLGLDALFGDGDISGAQIGGALGGIAGTIIGAAFGSPEIGAVIGQTGGQLLGKLVDKLTQSTKNAETLGRRGIEAFINEILDTNKLQIRTPEGIIDYDRLVQPNKKDFGNGVFDSIQSEIQRIEPEAFGVFSAFGGALGSLLTDDFANGVKIGTILLQDFGGDIDSLRLLVQTTGLSFDELQDSIVDAFLRGEIGALEAGSAIRDLGVAFEPGLAAVGAFDDAFDNLIESAGRGRFAIKSLQDIAIEAQEAGESSLDGLRQRLLSSGRFTEQQINQLFGTLAEQGIGSLEALADVNDVVAIKILSALEAQGDFFRDVTEGFDESADRAKNLGDQLERIDGFQAQASLRIRVQADFANGDARTALQAVEAAGGPGFRQ
jgi:hypothetical protein